MVLWGVPALQAQFQDLINQAHSQRDRYSGWRPPANERAPREISAADRAADAWAKKMVQQDEANAERVRQQKAGFDNLNTRAAEAFKRHDDREGLRWLHELRTAYSNAGIYSPDLRESIGRTEAILAWRDAKTSEEFRRAIAIQPHFFPRENLAYVEKLESIEAYVRGRPERAAQEQAARLGMHTMIDRLASSLDDLRQAKRPVLDRGTKYGAADAFGTRKSDPRPGTDTGTSEEHDSIRHGLGFDTGGEIYINDRPVPPSISTGRAIIPDSFLKHPAVIQLREFEAKADEAKRSAAAMTARYEEEATRNPNSNALLVLLSGAKNAQSRADNAENMVTFQITEIERTVTFAPFATGNSYQSPPQR